MSAKDGGTAFPLAATWHPCSGNQNNCEEYGMSLRDYFAAKALAGYYAAPNTMHEVDPVRVARYCYEQADAMLSERSKS